MAVSVANQWASTFNQPSAWGTTPPALQSVVVALNNSTSVGGGSGTPTAGNWLFTLVAMNESASAPGFTVGVGDDIHSFWRPGDETSSTWAVSTATGMTRTAVWYTANTARVAGNVYVAPNGCFDALAVLVVEVSGLGPWDTVTGINTNYGAAATSLSLALGAPSGAAFILGAVSGDNNANGPSFAPVSWTALHTVSASNGTDHTSDAQLASAWISTSGSVSVSGTATSGTDLSGVLIGVLASAPSPVPAAQNPNWPLVKCEAAFGGGFQTPQDQLTWTDLTSRLWSWNETSGIQYQLGQIQATQLELELDNFDNLLASDNPASYFYTAAGANWHPSSAFYDTLVAAATPGAWWKLADASGTTSPADSSGNSHTGTSSSVTFGNANEAVTGNTSAAFASGSTSHITSTYNPALSAVTVEAWVNLNSLPNTSPVLVANSSTASDHKGFALGLSGTTPQVTFGNSTTSATVTAGAALPASGWTYLAGTWDGTTVTLYVNGISQGTAALSGSMAAGTATGIGIGFNPATSSGYVNGLMAEVAVYGAALAASVIGSHYTAGPSVTGTPIRLRAAAGTLGGVTANRWYVISRNVEQWPQNIDPAYRRMINGTGTDIWSVLSASSFTPYRGEVFQDGPYAWWPMDDAPLTGGVLPTSLQNAAPGNMHPLNIVAAPLGLTLDGYYSETGINSTSVTTPVVSSAIYTVAADAGWMYGDPQSSPASYASSNPVTTNPGSASWQASGQPGNTGSHGFFLSCNDTGFPSLTGGVTVEGWFNYVFFGSSTGLEQSGSPFTVSPICQQPQTALTLFEIATGSDPVAILQLDTSGHLNLITYATGTSTGTSHSIYSSSDLRSQSWLHVAVELTATTWRVYVNGGATANVSGTGVNMNPAWTWLIVNGDLASNGGSSAGTGLVHGGNVSVSHFAVYPSQLPAWRVMAHYMAAATGFGLLPAPTAVAVKWLNTSNVTSGGPGTSFSGWYAPDGTANLGTYNALNGVLASAIVTANLPNSITSGPSAWTTATDVQNNTSGSQDDDTLWIEWVSVAPSNHLYTASHVGSETLAAVVAGSGDSFTAGYGSSATGAGVCQTAGGSATSPPTAASALGDTVAQRLERVLNYGQAPCPGRCIDPAALAVQAATDVGGQQAGQNVQNIAQSDGGMLYIDNLGNLTYWQKTHLASQYTSPVWTITPAAPPTAGASSSAIPYYREGFNWTEDPQRVYSAILITPFSPDGASLAAITPAQAAQVTASQNQYGAQPYAITSYLQSASEMQNQANFLFEYYGQSQIRVDGVKIDAAPYPAAFTMTLGINVGDVVSIANWEIGGGGIAGTFRVTQIQRTITFGGDDAEDNPRAEVVLQCDFEPPSYWSLSGASSQVEPASYWS